MDVPLVSLADELLNAICATAPGYRYDEQYMESEGVTEGWQKDILRRARRGGR